MITIDQLWISIKPEDWEQALKRYWDFVTDENRELERELENLDLSLIREMDSQAWYKFLLDKYFRWKFTVPEFYAENSARLKQYDESGKLADLSRIREDLLALDLKNIGVGLETARKIKGLGTAGASGLLALIYPNTFGTVDRFVVKALREIKTLPEATKLSAMNPNSISTEDGIVLITIMQRKAADNNQLFATTAWTPRKIDKILWTYGRS